MSPKQTTPCQRQQPCQRHRSPSHRPQSRHRRCHRRFSTTWTAPIARRKVPALTGRTLMCPKHHRTTRCSRIISQRSSKTITSITTALSSRIMSRHTFIVRASMQIVAISPSAICCQSHTGERWHSGCHLNFPSTDIPSPTSQWQPVAFSMQATTFTVGWQPHNTLVHWWQTSIRASPMIHMSNIAKTVSRLCADGQSESFRCSYCFIALESLDTSKEIHFYWFSFYFQKNLFMFSGNEFCCKTNPKSVHSHSVPWVHFRIDLLRHSLNWELLMSF